MSGLKVALVGAGYFGKFHLDAWSRMPEVEIVGIVDKFSEIQLEFSDSPPVFSDFESMLDAVQPDIVDIATPPQTHLDFIQKALPVARAIQCQKPFCTSIDDARRAVKLATDSSTTLAVHENFRFQPWHREIKQLLDSEALGEVYQATFRLRPGDGQGEDAYRARQPYFREMKQFLVRETAIHQIDLFRYFFGEPSGVFARLARLNPGIAGEDAGFILFDFPGGARAVFDGNRLADHAAEDTRRTMGELVIEGSAATVRLDGDARLWLRAHGSRDETEISFEWRDHLFGGDCVYATCRAFLDHVLTGTPLENDAAAYLANQEIVESVYRSNAEGRWLEIG